VTYRRCATYQPFSYRRVIKIHILRSDIVYCVRTKAKNDNQSRYFHVLSCEVRVMKVYRSLVIFMFCHVKYVWWRYIEVSLFSCFVMWSLATIIFFLFYVVSTSTFSRQLSRTKPHHTNCLRQRWSLRCHDERSTRTLARFRTRVYFPYIRVSTSNPLFELRNELIFFVDGSIHPGKKSCETASLRGEHDAK
jgi:hypothetical protein